MSSTEITTCEDSCNKPVFPLPPEIRTKIYEQLLIRTNFSTGKKDRCVAILRTCRTFYEEAIPILYGENNLYFNDHRSRKPVFSFPERHLAMIKRAEVDIRPSVYSSAEKMGNFLLALGTSGAKLVHLSIRIHMHEYNDKWIRERNKKLPPLSLFDQSLVGDHPIVAGLFALKAVKKLDVRMVDEARFGPGVATALREAFMKDGTTDGRSITIERECTFPHERKLEEYESCSRCGNTWEDLVNGTANWGYRNRNDEFTWKAVWTYNTLRHENSGTKDFDPFSLP